MPSIAPPPRLARRANDHVRRGWFVLSDLRFEVAVVVLLLLTALAIQYGDRILSSKVVIDGKNASTYTTAWHDDASVGGSSTISADPRHPLRWSCELRPQYQYPFCGYEILLDAKGVHGLDLRRFQTMTLTIDYRGRADSIRLYLKNFDPRFGNAADRETDKFNQIQLPIKHRQQVLRAKLADFDVPDWWTQKNHIPFRYSQPQFDNVVAIEIDTGNGAQPGLHQFQISSITLRGNLLTMDQWYLGILGCWIALICLFLMARIVQLQRDLAQRRTLQDVAVSEAQRAREFARRDHLTGLFNRLGVTDRYQQMITMHPDQPVAIMLIDVDHFKSINDRFGHMMGDDVLSAFAEVLQSHTRGDDLIGRWGGEEFLLVCRVLDAHAAVEIANKLRATVENNEFGIHGALTASFGVYYCDVAPGNLGVGVTCADHALYDAKEKGRNRVVLYHAPVAQDVSHKVAETERPPAS